MKTTMAADRAADLKTIVTEYPSTFPLQGSERLFFDYRLKKMFRQGYLKTSTLDSLRKQIGLPRLDQADCDSLEDLNYDNFTEMPPEILCFLPSLVGECLGIKIHWFSPSLPNEAPLTERKVTEPQASQLLGGPYPQIRKRRGWRIAFPVALVLLLLVGIGWKFRSLAPASGPSPFLATFSAKPSVLPLLKNSTPEVLNATLSTSAVQSSLHRLSATIPKDGTVYQVHLTVAREKESR
jgi:hypothetical protein